MDRKQIRKIMSHLRRELMASGVADARVVLIGSTAAGRRRRDSDLDVVVVSPSFNGKGLFSRARSAGAAEVATVRKFLVPLDILLLTPAEFAARRGEFTGQPFGMTVPARSAA